MELIKIFACTAAHGIGHGQEHFTEIQRSKFFKIKFRRIHINYFENQITQYLAWLENQSFLGTVGTVSNVYPCCIVYVSDTDMGISALGEGRRHIRLLWFHSWLTIRKRRKHRSQAAAIKSISGLITGDWRGKWKST